MLAYSLQTEYLNNPLGIDVLNPRFFWKCQAEGEECFQSAYRLEVYHEEGKVLWDTGKIFSGQATHILYDGEPLESRMRVCWRVKLWDEHDLEGEWSEQAFFEIGLLSESDWTAKWITAPITPKKAERYPADCFQKTIHVQKKIEKARLYATACGVYCVQINGARVGLYRFTPGYTDYFKRVQYQTYDVTQLLAPGENSLEFTLGDGWFRGKIGAYNKRCAYGLHTKLLAQLELYYSDGSREIYGTDGSFFWSNDGPIRENDMKDGEVYDANLSPEYRKRARETVHTTKLVCSNNVPVREKERFSARLICTPNGQRVLDFSQNIAGYVECRLPAALGQTLMLRFGETLDSEGNFTQTNLQLSPHPKQPTLQRLQITCSNKPLSYKPEFCVFGFRYVLLENWPDEIDPGDFTAIAVYSDMEETGEFSCDNNSINQLFQNTRWSMKGNFLDVPTDCPQRERNPWTGDAQVFFETGAYLMNLAPLIRKWMRDIVDAQRADGAVRSLAPYQGEDQIIRMLDGSAGWADAIILIPYQYYRMYGDLDLFRECYPAMKRYAEFLIRRAKKHSLLFAFQKNPYRKYTVEVGQHWGEWLEPKDEHFESMFALGFPRREEATAYFAYSMRCISEIAQKLALASDATRYAEYFTGAKRAYNFLFVHNDDIESSRPAKLVRPLAIGLLDVPAKENVARRLESVMEARGYTVGTGFLSTPFLLETLSDNGYPDAALETLLQEKSPGWLHSVLLGATTIWEQWEGMSENGIGSLNHYSKGAVCKWLMQALGGIRMGETETFYIRPLINRRIGEVCCSYDSIYGKASCRWRLNDNLAEIAITIPTNTKARVCLPDGSERVVLCGEHTFSVEFD